MADFFEKPQRRHIKELNLVAIIDMFTTVIFFLLLSTSFIILTKLTVPPSKVSTITSPVAPPPLAPKMLLVHHRPEEYRLILTWAGREPGQTDDFFATPTDKPIQDFMAHSKKMIAEFAKKYPDEKTIQLGLGGDVPYQAMISTMDGIRELIPDIVLISNEEAEARAKATIPKDKRS
jgi:hypothetical protein